MEARTRRDHSLLLLAACGDRESQVGEFSNDLAGNEIMIEALPDPAIPGVVCHVAYFDRSFLDRMQQGNWFENPSNSSVSCQRIGPIDLARHPHQPLGRRDLQPAPEPVLQEHGRAAHRRPAEPLDRLRLALARTGAGLGQAGHFHGGADGGGSGDGARTINAGRRLIAERRPCAKARLKSFLRSR